MDLLNPLRDVTVDPASDVPPYRQIVDSLWIAVAEGELPTGLRLPTVRELAVALSVHPNTVARAYDELELLGVIIRRPGEGTVVGVTRSNRDEIERRARLEQLCREIIERAAALGYTTTDVIDVLSAIRQPHD